MGLHPGAGPASGSLGTDSTTGVGYALEYVSRLTDNDGFRERLLPTVDRYHDWLFANRDHDRDGLISIITPYESGTDHKPAYDLVVGSRSGHGRQPDPRLRRLDIGNKRRGFSLTGNVRRRRFHAEDVLVNTFLSLSLSASAESHRALGDAAVAHSRIIAPSESRTPSSTAAGIPRLASSGTSTASRNNH